MPRIFGLAISSFGSGRPDGATRQRSRVRRPGVELLEGRRLLSGNVFIYNPPSTNEPFSQSNPVEVVNSLPVEATYKLSITSTGSGAAYLSSTSSPAPASSLTVKLAAYATSFVKFTPIRDSSKPDDVHIVESLVSPMSGQQVADVPVTIASVTFGTTPGVNSLDVRNADTPTQMKDRIPPTAKTPVYVNVTPDLTGSGESVALTVTGQSTANGTVAINGSTSSLTITKSQTVNLIGLTQTAPADAKNPNNLSAPNARKLQLTVVDRGKNTVQSQGFSVAAIPVGVYEIYRCDISLGNTQFVGNYDYVTFVSDSGNPGDLNALSVLEHLAVTANSGGFDGSIGGHDTAYMALTLGSINGAKYAYKMDANALGKSGLSAPAGAKTWTQYYTFQDSRTGASGTPVAKSGFTWTMTVYQDPVSRLWTVEVAKKGIAVGSVAAGSVSDPSGKIDYKYTH